MGISPKSIIFSFYLFGISRNTLDFHSIPSNENWFRIQTQLTPVWWVPPMPENNPDGTYFIRRLRFHHRMIVVLCNIRVNVLRIDAMYFICMWTARWNCIIRSQQGRRHCADDGTNHINFKQKTAYFNDYFDKFLDFNYIYVILLLVIWAIVHTLFIWGHKIAHCSKCECLKICGDFWRLLLLLISKIRHDVLRCDKKMNQWILNHVFSASLGRSITHVL